jgi:hypothetical protein
MHKSPEKIPEWDNNIPRSYQANPQMRYPSPPYVLYQERRGGWSPIRELINLGMLAAFLAFFSISFILVGALIWGMSLVIPQTFSHSTSLYIATPWLIELVVLEGFAFFLWYIFIVSCILASFTWLFWKDGMHAYRNFPNFMRRSRKLPNSSSNAMIMVPQLFFVNIFINFVFVLILMIFGVETTVPSFLEDAELWKRLYALANASVYEELITRVLLIGIPLLLIDIIRRKSNMEFRKYILGGNFEPTLVPVIFVLISSMIFASAHFFAWDAFKVILTFFGGVIFGYLFIKKGLYTCIILHFFVDYLAITMEVTGFVFGIMVVLIMLFWVVMGGFCTALYLKLLNKYLKRANRDSGI